MLHNGAESSARLSTAHITQTALLVAALAKPTRQDKTLKFKSKVKHSQGTIAVNVDAGGQQCCAELENLSTADMHATGVHGYEKGMVDPAGMSTLIGCCWLHSALSLN